MERPLHRNREYVELWVGQTVSALGISISSFAHPLVVLAATGSPAKAGLVGSVLARHDVLPASARRRAHRPLEQEGDPRRVRRRARAVRGRVVAPPQVRDAIARNQSRMQLAGLVGPPLGGVLLGVGRALPFVADAVSYLVSLVGVLFVRSSLLDPPARRSKRRIAGRCWTACAGCGAGRSSAASSSG